MRFIVLIAALACAGCVTAPRLDAPLSVDAVPVGFDSHVRFYASDPVSRDQFAAATTAQLAAASPDGRVHALALSGGGAGGAFGAGALVGLSESGRRPRFEMVTGVSTGALLAPFAFLGSDWDASLIEAYTTGASDHLIQSRGIGVPFGTSLDRGRPLQELVERFVTTELVAAVARESAKGRRLFVATTDLDTEETVIWDMGAIAAQGGPNARRMFVDVLVASASIPGLFPPVLITAERNGSLHQEMHVDGGASIPLFIAPQIAMDPDYSPSGLQGGDVYIIVNGQLSQQPRTTPRNGIAIATRSFFSMTANAARIAIGQTHLFASRTGMTFNFTMIPSDYPYQGPLDFNRNDMTALFEYGRRCAEADLIWWNGPRGAAMRVEQTRGAFSADTTACPAANGGDENQTQPSSQTIARAATAASMNR